MDLSSFNNFNQFLATVLVLTGALSGVILAFIYAIWIIFFVKKRDLTNDEVIKVALLASIPLGLTAWLIMYNKEVEN